jgi:dihydroorotate dehydrogenase/Pyruvate/2-oxoacid:ferredoxin oxidoreductase delta subunit
MAVDISTNIAGVKMRSPFGVASCDPDKALLPGKKYAEIFMKYVDAGAGYIISPAIKPGDPLPEEIAAEKSGLASDWQKLYRKQYYGRYCKVEDGTTIWAGHSLQLCLNFYEEWINWLKPRLPKDVPILAQSLVYEFDPQAWVDHSLILESMGADLIEINAGCPCDAMKGSPGIELPEESKYGAMMGTEPDLLCPIITAVSKACKVPVGFKMTGEMSYPRFLFVAEKALEAGARWVVTNHMSFSVAPPDIWNGGKTRFPAYDINPFGALMGSALRYQAYKTTAVISNTFPKLQTWAGGGIDKPEHVVEQIMLGASAVQTLHGIMHNGVTFIARVNNFLRSFMEKCGYKTIEDFRGISLKYFKGMNDGQFLDYVAETDLGKCTACGKCADTYCPAISFKDGMLLTNIEECTGCGMCQIPCPVDAKKFVPRPRPFPS